MPCAPWWVRRGLNWKTLDGIGLYSEWRLWKHSDSRAIVWSVVRGLGVSRYEHLLLKVIWKAVWASVPESANVRLTSEGWWVVEW